MRERAGNTHGRNLVLEAVRKKAGYTHETIAELAIQSRLTSPEQRKRGLTNAFSQPRYYEDVSE